MCEVLLSLLEMPVTLVPVCLLVQAWAALLVLAVVILLPMRYRTRLVVRVSVVGFGSDNSDDGALQLGYTDARKHQAESKSCDTGRGEAEQVTLSAVGRVGIPRM